MDLDLAASAFLVAIAAVLIAAIWYAAVRKRTAVSSELQRLYAEQAAETQRLLADVSAQLADLNRRTADMQRILKDAE
jgi:Skp family chaperone for outer membrane proteins